MQQLQTRKVSKNYEISTTSTLVDLNQDLTNFVAEFKVYPTKDKSKNYKIAVVDQTHIDNSEIEFKDVTGDIGATVSWDKGVYKNHYIALKSSDPLEVTVDIELKELPKKNVESELEPGDESDRGKSRQMLEGGGRGVSRNRAMPLGMENSDEIGKSESRFKNVWFRIALVCIVLIGVILLFKFFLSPSKKSRDNNTPPQVYVPSAINIEPLSPATNVNSSDIEKLTTVVANSVIGGGGSPSLRMARSSPSPRASPVPSPKPSPVHDSLSQKIFSRYKKNYAF